MDKQQTIITPEQSGKRIDALLSTVFPDYSRSYFQKLIEENFIKINDKKIKPNYKAKEGDRVEIIFKETTRLSEPEAENIPLDILYEDKNIIVLNKQPGLVVHPAAGNTSGTLVNALIAHFPAITEAVYDNVSFVSRIRPGLVQRLDKDTSGVMVVAKNAKAMHSLAMQIQNRTIKKLYIALCFGWPKNEEGRVASYLGRHPQNRKIMANIGPDKGKEAITEYQVLEYLKDKKGNKLSLTQFYIKTGRTHQIRVHAASINHPIMGDSVYGNKLSTKLAEELGIKRQLLHSKRLTLYLPGHTTETTFEAPIPDDLKTALAKLNKV